MPAARQDAPRVHDSGRSNVCFDADLGDFDSTEAAFARAAHVTRFETWVQRITWASMEPRAALAEYDKASGRRTAPRGGAGAVVKPKNTLAKMLDVPPEQVRVLMQDVGGNFGTRGMIYAEFGLIAWAARQVGRPVKWIIERHEALLSDYQARDLAVEAELALDDKGRFIAMRGSNLGNPMAPTPRISRMVQKGVQMMPAGSSRAGGLARARATLSHTSPTRLSLAAVQRSSM